MILKKFIALIIIIFSFSVTYAFGNEKTVYLNVDLLVNNSIFGKKTLNILKELNDKNIKDLTFREEEIKKKDKEISKIKNIISNEEFEKKIINLKEEIKDYNVYKNQLATNLNDTRKKELKIFFEKINPIIQNYMNENSIDIIIDKKNIFIAKSEYDITNDILKLIDKKIK